MAMHSSWMMMLQLDDDAGVDVGLDRKREDRSLGEGAAGHDVQQAQDGVLQGIEVGLQSSDVHIGDRDGVAKTVKQNDEKSEEDLLAELLDLPCFA